MRGALRRPQTDGDPARHDLAYPLAAIGFRFPGLGESRFSRVVRVAGHSRGRPRPAARLADEGKALDGQWLSMPYFPEGQLGFAVAALSSRRQPRRDGRPTRSDRFELRRARRPARAVRGDEAAADRRSGVSRNSISALASDWAERSRSTATVDRLRARVDRARNAGRRRPRRETLSRRQPRGDRGAHAVGGCLPIGAAAPSVLTRENPLGSAIRGHALARWGNDRSPNSVPASGLAPVQTKLSNGIDLIVQPETISDSVFVYGNVKTTPQLQEPLGKEGISRVLAEMYATARRRWTVRPFCARPMRSTARWRAARDSPRRRRRKISIERSHCSRKTSCSRGSTRRRWTSRAGARSTNCRPN